MFKTLTPAIQRCYFTTLFGEPLFLPETLEHKSILKLNIKRNVHTVQYVQYRSTVFYIRHAIQDFYNKISLFFIIKYLYLEYGIYLEQT
jgi:hypothetical protein